MTSLLLLLSIGYVVAFFYTLNKSYKNSKQLAVLQAEVATLKSAMATGAMPAAVPVPAEAAVEATQQDAAASAIPAQTDVDEPAETSDATSAPIATPAIAASVAPAETPASAVSTPKAPVRSNESFESKLGARWAVWAGGLALALGGIFLVKVSIESGLLSPAVRLALAAVFGLLLALAGEAIRRKAVPGVTAAYANAMIPGVLTAAGALTLFGVIYASYGIYEYFGPTTAFALLALVAFATIGLSLLHGQALAGLGLLGSMITPALISTQTPNIWALFGFLTVSWAATAVAARRQGWKVVPALANVGLALWALGYIAESTSINLVPPTFALLAMIAGTIFIWPGKSFETVPQRPSSDAQEKSARISSLVFQFVGRPPVGISLTVSLAAVLPAVSMLFSEGSLSIHPAFAMSAIIAALAALGASRHYAIWPAIFSALAALAGVSLMARSGLELFPTLRDGNVILPAVHTGYGTEMAMALGLGAIFLLCGFSFIKRKGDNDASFATLWAAIAAIVPVWLATISFVEYGNLGRDWLHAAYGLALGLLLLGGAEWMHRRDRPSDRWPLNLFIIGSFAAFVFTLHTLTEGLLTTVLLSVIGFGYVLATRKRAWEALPWIMALASVGVLGRIAWEPTIVGPQNLGTTPVFNALLPGYGIPALLAISAAFLLRNWPGYRAKNFLQAIASLMGLLTIAILVRHAMNGGVLSDTVPTLGEQSIYTLLTIGMSGVLMTLDLKSPSPIFRYGSMLAGVIGMINVLALHFGALNPYFSGENTGPWPFLNLLLIGYLLPGLAYGGLAFYARGKRPMPYVIMLALSGAALGFAWATLSVRRFWQGENIVDWKGFLQSETYSYSVVWLVIGVLLLALGSRFNAKSLRLASAALVLLAVAKAFLIDMSNLEGVLRALSFIGLGVVLIGIGLFYQKILSGKPDAAEEPVARDEAGA